jgi:hypothetical protein
MSSKRFRQIALALPEVVEGSHQGHADFRVGKRIFATLGYPDDDWGMVKLTPDQRSVLVGAEPEIFRPVPGGWGKHGNTNVRLARAVPRRCKARLRLPGATSHRSRSDCPKRRSADFALHQFLMRSVAHFLRVHPFRGSGLIRSIAGFACRS